MKDATFQLFEGTFSVALIPYKTNHVITFWIPLPTPLGVAAGTELCIKSPGPFPENSPGFHVPDHPAGAQYLAQSWLFFQKTQPPTSHALEFAEELFNDRSQRSLKQRLRNVLGKRTSELDIPTIMLEIGTQWHTVVEVMCPLESPAQEHVVTKLNEAVNALSNFQVGLSQLNGMPAHILTPRSIDPVPYSVSSTTHGEIVRGLTSTGNVTKYASSVNVPIATEPELQRVADAAFGKSSSFRSAAVLDMEAQSARISGAHILAAICFGAAAESRLTELGMFLSWEAEEDYSTVKSATSDVTDRLLQHLAKHLKGNWNRKQSEPIRLWDQHIRELRNAVAHRGYEPTVADIDLADAARQELNNFIRTKLLKRVSTYPHVSINYLGSNDIRQSGQFDTWTKAMTGYSLPPDPEASFTRYKTEVKAVGMSTTMLRALKGGTIVQITDAQKKQKWIELDEATLFCREVSVSSPEEWYEIQRIVGRYNNGETTERLLESKNPKTTPQGNWTSASTVIPSYSTKRSDGWEILESQIKAR